MAERAPLPIVVIGGYLGAGKTTLLNSLIAQSAGRRLGVVVNDFGELGVDAQMLAAASQGAPGSPGVVNLPNGCVCCTLGDDLMRTLTDLAALDPPLDEIVVEASGVADPAATAAWGTVPPFTSGGIVVLVAADTIDERLRDRYVGGEVRRQIEGADLVLLTKTDLVEPMRVDAARRRMGQLTTAPVLDVVAGAVPFDVVLGPTRRSAARRDPDVRDAHHAHRYVRWSLVDDRRVSPDAIRAALDELPDGLLRLKGFVGLLGDEEIAIVNVVGGRVDVAIRTVSDDHPGGVRLEAIGIGATLDVDALDRAVAQLFSAG